MLQVIVVLMNRPGKGVFDGYHGARGPAIFQAAKNILEAFAGKDGGLLPYKFPCGFLAKRPACTLKGDQGRTLHFAAPSQRRTCASAIPIKSNTRSILWSTMSNTVCG